MALISRLSTYRSLQIIVLDVLFHQARLVASIINFETFLDGSAIPDSTNITNQFPGLTFSNTTVITAGMSLNEFEFPPHSGVNAVFDDGSRFLFGFRLVA
jgi:hypothetical protein